MVNVKTRLGSGQLAAGIHVLESWNNGMMGFKGDKAILQHMRFRVFGCCSSQHSIIPAFPTFRVSALPHPLLQPDQYLVEFIPEILHGAPPVTDFIFFF